MVHLVARARAGSLPRAWTRVVLPEGRLLVGVARDLSVDVALDALSLLGLRRVVAWSLERLVCPAMTRVALMSISPAASLPLGSAQAGDGKKLPPALDRREDGL